MLSKKRIPEIFRRKLVDISVRAHRSQNYLPAAKVFEKYQKLYDLDEDLKYKLGQLYDHIVIFQLKRPTQRNIRRRYIKKAESIYKSIIAINRKSIFAFHGLSRLRDIQGKHNEAWYYAKRAYLLWKKLPKTKKGPLGTGNNFLLAGDFKKAEYWFKKELTELGPRNLGAQVNLLILYNTTKKHQDVLKQARIVEKLLDLELKRPKHRRIVGGVNDKTVQFIRAHIKRAKLVAEKNHRLLPMK